MKKGVFGIIFLLFGLNSLKAQLNIEECYKLASENYPLVKQYNLIEKTKEFNLANANKGYLPQLSISAQASYQSAVTKVPLGIPGIQVPHKDQYMAQIKIDQTIWDGGVINSKRQTAESSASVSAKQLEVEMYTIRERVNELYFGILLLEAQLEQNRLYQQELGRNHSSVTSYIEYGIANQSDLDVVKVEQLKAKQDESTVLLTKKSFTSVLSQFLGIFDINLVVLEKPQENLLSFGLDIKRPELELFAAHYNNLEAQKGIIKSSYMPKLGLFAQGGYGRPGLNMLKTTFEPFYIAGVHLSWNISSLYTSDNESKIIKMNQEMILNQHETFLFNIKMELTQDQLAVEKQRKLLEQDDEIVQLRGNVKQAAEAKLANGVITVTDLMREITEENLAKQDRILHEIELLQAIYNIKHATNN